MVIICEKSVNSYTLPPHVQLGQLMAILFQETPMPCAHFGGLTERFAREIEAVKTQYPFEDMKIQCGLTGVDPNWFYFFHLISIKGI